jgi:hypothetical protein
VTLPESAKPGVSVRVSPPGVIKTLAIRSTDSFLNGSERCWYLFNAALRCPVTLATIESGTPWAKRIDGRDASDHGCEYSPGRTPCKRLRRLCVCPNEGLFQRRAISVTMSHLRGKDVIALPIAGQPLQLSNSGGGQGNDFGIVILGDWNLDARKTSVQVHFSPRPLQDFGFPHSGQGRECHKAP